MSARDAARIEPIGVARSGPRAAADIPHYRKMVTTAVERMGRTVGDFHGFRLRYPPIPTLCLYRYELPERA